MGGGEGRARRALRTISTHVLGGRSAATVDEPAASVTPPLELRDLGPRGFGAEVCSLTISAAMDDAETKQLMREAIDRHGVLCLRFGVQLDDTQLRGVVECFGPIKDRVGRCRDGVVRPYTAASPGSRIDEQINVLDTSRGADGGGGPGATNWHTDDSYCEVPCGYTALHPRELPPSGGGGTQFLNMRHAYEALPPETQRQLEGMRGVHWQASTTAARALFGRGTPGPDSPKSFDLTNLVDVTHPLVRTHPNTGRKALYMNLDRMMCIEGMSVEESAPLLNHLEYFAEQAGTRYVHKWEQGDVVVWDNRCVQHRAAPKATVRPGERRVMWQMMVDGEVPF
jgi:taurine dioxygenase